jgi:anti-anti-sigma factor
MEPFEIKREESRGVVIVSPAGELDIATADRLDQELRRVEELKPRLLVLDLRSLTFMDSSGVRTILLADTRSRQNGARLTIVRGPEEVDRVFRITGIAEHLQIVDELPDPSKS